MEDVKGCVQLANDPQIELAHDLLLLKQEVNQLREYNSELIQSCNEYRQQLAQLTSCNQELQHRMSIITREYKEQIVSYKQQIQEKDAVIQQLNNRIERLQSEKAELWQMYAPLFYEGYQNTSYESDCIGCKEAGVTEAKMCDEYSRGGLSEPSDIEYTIDDLRRKFNSKMR